MLMRAQFALFQSRHFKLDSFKSIFLFSFEISCKFPFFFEDYFKKFLKTFWFIILIKNRSIIFIDQFETDLKLSGKF